jgi:hypothetical protein
MTISSNKENMKTSIREKVKEVRVAVVDMAVRTTVFIMKVGGTPCRLRLTYNA